MKNQSTSPDLPKWLASQAALQTAEALKPLDSTRTLGERFGVSHGTVFRLLCRMEESGKVWRHPNGRFYPALAGRVLGRPKPLAVMLRRLGSWSALSREIMEGFTERCGEQERPILLFHNKKLLTQESADSSAQIASIDVQAELLRDFFLLHGETIGGVLFDELWSDEAIRRSLPKNMPAVSVYRSGTVEGVGYVAADFRAGALLAMGHLMACGYDRICVINPFPNYEPAQAFLVAAREVYREVFGRTLSEEQVVPIFDQESQKRFLRRLGASKERWGLICPEDNLSRRLAQELAPSKKGFWRQHGLVSVMGTSLIESGELTCVRYDFRKMGRLAGESLSAGELDRTSLPPRLELGRSTKTKTKT